MTEEKTPPQTEIENTHIQKSLDHLGRSVGLKISVTGETGMKGSYKLEFDDNEVEMINDLALVARSNPDLIIESIQSNPPEIGYLTEDGEVEIIKPNIETIPASPAEAQAATLADNTNLKVDPLTSSALKGLSSFLRAPKVHDGIANHTKRQHYENGMSVMLNLIETAAKKTSSQKIEKPLDQQFLNWWNNNKYTKNMRHKVNQAVQLISKSSPDSPIQSNCQTFISNFNERGYDKQYIPESELENSVQFLTDHAIAIVTTLSELN